MSLGYEDSSRAAASPRGRLAATRLVAAVLLVVAAALTVGGSFGAFWTYMSTRIDPATGDEEVTTVSANGWWQTTSDPDLATSSPPRDGILLTVGALLALVAVIMLLVSARRADDPAAPRLAGVGAAAFLIGNSANIWIVLLSVWEANSAPDNPDIPLQYSYGVGIGSWLLIAAIVVAFVAVGLLMTPRRAAPVGGSGVGPRPTPAYGSRYGALPRYPHPGAPAWPAPGGPQGPAWPRPGGPPSPVGGPVHGAGA